MEHDACNLAAVIWQWSLFASTTAFSSVLVQRHLNMQSGLVLAFYSLSFAWVCLVKCSLAFYSFISLVIVAGVFAGCPMLHGCSESKRGAQQSEQLKLLPQESQVRKRRRRRDALKHVLLLAKTFGGAAADGGAAAVGGSAAKVRKVPVPADFDPVACPCPCKNKDRYGHFRSGIHEAWMATNAAVAVESDVPAAAPELPDALPQNEEQRLAAALESELRVAAQPDDSSGDEGADNISAGSKRKGDESGSSSSASRQSRRSRGGSSSASSSSSRLTVSMRGAAAGGRAGDARVSFEVVYSDSD